MSEKCICSERESDGSNPDCPEHGFKKSICDEGMCIVGLATIYNEAELFTLRDVTLSNKSLNIIRDTACHIFRKSSGAFTIFNFCPICGIKLDTEAIKQSVYSCHNPDTCDFCQYLKEKED